MASKIDILAVQKMGAQTLSAALWNYLGDPECASAAQNFVRISHDFGIEHTMRKLYPKAFELGEKEISRSRK